jgi:hypothetical protein
MIWAAFGDVANYVEPFFGSGAVLFGRPNKHTGRTVTINDSDGHLCNVWRALKTDPEAVAAAADWPVSECDLTARHLWLVEQRAALTARLQTDPDYFDPKAAGWWIWGACSWIGSGWCSGEGPWSAEDGQWVKGARQLPHVGNAGRGINRKLPHVGNAGRGINRKLPHVGDAGRGAAILEWFAALQDRLRTARITCGDWSRVCTPVVTYRHGLTGVVLDPPYPEGFDPNATYSGQTGSAADLWRDVVGWAEENGRRPDMRIVLCGYEGSGDPPSGWRRVYWAARGGYGNAGGTDAEDNRHRETLWLSPACLAITATKGRQSSMFGVTG